MTIKKVHDLEKHFIRENYMWDFIDFQIKYDGTRWTEDPNCTIFLFWLGNAGRYFSGLKKGEDGVYRTDLDEAVYDIEPMESPSDPNLKKLFPKNLL